MSVVCLAGSAPLSLSRAKLSFFPPTSVKNASRGARPSILLFIIYS